MLFSSVNRPGRFRQKPGKGGRTKQSMRDECDINLIMARFQTTGAVTHFAKHGGDYGFAPGIDFHAAMNIVTRAEQMFDDLPSSVRNKFHSDPAEFLDFVQDPTNAAEMIELGLREPVSAAERTLVAEDAPIAESPPAELEEAPDGADTVVT